MRNFLNAIKELPHPEERPIGASRRTHDRDAAPNLDPFTHSEKWPSIPFDTEESPDHPLYSGNPWLLPVVGGYYRLRDSLDRLLA